MVRFSLVLLGLTALGCSSSPATHGTGSPSTGGHGSGDGDSNTGDGDDVGNGDGDNGSGDGDGDGTSVGPGCGDTLIQARPLPADILIVQDRSSSMSGISISAGVGTDRWTPSTQALKKVVTDYQDSIQFGLLLFPSNGQACDKGSLSVPIMAKAASKVGTALDMNAPSTLFNGIGQTPTDLALQQAYEVIEKRQHGDFETSVINDAYVLLVTDGAPGCNLGMAEQARVDASNAVIDKLLKIDVKTYVVGYDIDAAGQTIMNEFAKRGGTGKYIAVDTMNSLALEKALRDVTAGNVPCKFQLPGAPTSTSEVTVRIDDTDVVISEENGWTLNGEVVELNGPACASIRDGKQHDVNVNVPCGALL